MHRKLAESLGGTTAAPLEENETSHRGFREKSFAAKAGSWGAGWGEGCQHITGELGAVLAANGRLSCQSQGKLNVKVTQCIPSLHRHVPLIGGTAEHPEKQAPNILGHLNPPLQQFKPRSDEVRKLVGKNLGRALAFLLGPKSDELCSFLRSPRQHHHEGAETAPGPAGLR